MANYISQTSRTILFEEFSTADNVPRLDFLLSNNMEISHLKIKDRLTVRSFEEFLEKFDPKYYECTAVAVNPENGEEFPVFTYSLKKPLSGNASERRLADQPFYKAMMDLYSQKGASGQSDAGFDFRKITSLAYSPEKAMDDARDIRSRLSYNFTEYMKIEEKGGSEAEKADYAAEIKRLRKRIRDDYMSQSQFNLIPLIIEDTKDRLKRLEVSSDVSESAAALITKRVEITFDGSGRPQYIEMKHDNTGDDTIMIATSAESAAKRLTMRLGADFDTTAEKGKNLLCIPDDPQSTAFMKKTLLSVFAGKSFDEAELTADELKSNLELYEQMYKVSQQNFAQNVVALVEKIINVKAFFDHAGENAELVVSNCPLSGLVTERKFENFIKQMGQECTDERIWFAIVPAVDHADFVAVDGVKKSASLDDDLDDEEENTDVNTLLPFSTLKSVLRLFGVNDIITFFNFKGCNKTSSSMMSRQLIADYKKELSFAGGEAFGAYSVFCYPNFTVLPDRASSVKIGNDYIKLPPVFVDASYIAAGLSVKTQNRNELSRKGFLCKGDVPPVRFDFEGAFDTEFGDKKVPLSQIFTTEMNRELTLTMQQDITEEIKKDGGFGFCFCGDEKWYDYNKRTAKQNHSYVFRARTLARDSVRDSEGNPTGESRYRPIFKTMVKTYFNKLAKMTNEQQIRKLCDEYMGGLNKKRINNVVYSSECSSVKTEESIEMKGQSINIVYDSDRDDFTLRFEEN